MNYKTTAAFSKVFQLVLSGYVESHLDSRFVHNFTGIVSTTDWSTLHWVEKLNAKFSPIISGTEIPSSDLLSQVSISLCDMTLAFLHDAGGVKGTALELYANEIRSFFSMPDDHLTDDQVFMQYFLSLDKAIVVSFLQDFKKYVLRNTLAI